jgi:hypothetical protein
LYLTPASQLDHPELPALLEHLTVEAGKWGVFHVLAEVDETGDVFVSLRKAGFSVYAWQRMWDVSNLAEAGPRSDWKRVHSLDLPAIQSLHYQIIPQLLHPVEPAPSRALGFVSADGMKCFASVASGLAGIVITPIIHPDIHDVAARLAALIHGLPDRRNRPVYLCVRSYQTWLEPALEDLGAQAAERQAVMVKRMTRLVHEEQPVPAVPSAASIQPSRMSRIDGDK